MRAKHPQMASDQANMGLKWGGLAPQSTRIIEKQPLRQQRSCARWVFPQPVKGRHACNMMITSASPPAPPLA
jgi:hypothetical protein